MAPWRMTAGLTRLALKASPSAWQDSPLGRRQRAWSELVLRTRLHHERPRFGIDRVGASEVAQETAAETPFAELLHFRKTSGVDEPRVMIVAPLSGHFGTLMRETVRTMLADHDVYLVDWKNARDIPLEAGRFGLDGYIDHVIRFLELLGPPTHAMAVCQPGPAVLAATALMAEDGSPATPRSLTLMASPIDTSASPTAVNDLARRTPLDWFADHVVMPVPPGHPGFGRRVYPGFMQISAFMAMNTDRHLDQHAALYWNLVRGNWDEAATIREFYDEYFSVLDMDGDYYLETIDAVFQRNLLANGLLEWRGRRVDPSAIRATSLQTVEGERDDVCGIGQTSAAHDLLTSVRPANKRHHLQVGVGHYGVFSGRRWEHETYPIVRQFILASS